MGKRQIKRYHLTIPLEWDLGDEQVSATISYATYASTEKEAVEIGNLFIQDNREQVSRSVSDLIAAKIVDDGWQSCELTGDIDVEEVSEFGTISSLKAEEIISDFETARFPSSLKEEEI